MNQVLKTALESSPYTKRQIAALAKISEAKLSQMIAGGANPSLKQARDIAALLNKPVDVIFPPAINPVINSTHIHTQTTN